MGFDKRTLLVGLAGLFLLIIISISAKSYFVAKEEARVAAENLKRERAETRAKADRLLRCYWPNQHRAYGLYTYYLEETKGT